MNPPITKPVLSIVLPAYNEARRLPKSLVALATFVESFDREVELLVVDNSSTDTTAEVVAQHQQRLPYLRMLSEPTPGKGAAVRRGMLAAVGDHLMFCDADFSMPVHEIAKFTALLDTGAPIVIASRELATSERHHEPTRRHVMGRVFNFAVQSLIIHGIEDTQCGFKAFQRPVARDLFSLQRVHGWGFDVEILFLARKRGYRVQQLAIDWFFDPDSRVRGMRDSVRTFAELLKIRWYSIRGFYARESPADQDR